MTERKWRFRPIDQRNDIGDIKSKCYQTSKQALDSDKRWNTTYKDDYIRYGLARTNPAGAPPEGIHIGGGNLRPNEQEMTSNYSQFFTGYKDTDVPKRADPLPESDFMPHDAGIPESTAHAAMNEVANNTPKYDNKEAKERVTDGKKSHFYFNDPNDFETQYERDFKNFRGARHAVIDNELMKSHVEFDSNAGYGPHKRSTEKKGKFPEKPDVPKPDHLKINFDVGYNQSPYRTTYQDSVQDYRYNKRPTTCKAPACAELSTHGDAAGKWGSTYRNDFENRPRIENEIDFNDLRATHWDQGHDPEDWSRRTQPTTSRKPKREFKDLQKSNIVFKGDGTMTFNTTSNDLVGVYDRNGEARCDADYMDARSDHLFLGGDKQNFVTTASEANRSAGKGRPATSCEDLHHKRGTGFATGGAWDPYVMKDPISEKRPRYQEQAPKIDGRYFTQTHFDLDATNANKARYKTTYFQTICKPKIY